MRKIFTLFLFIQSLVLAVAPDFDVIVVGSSPVSLLDALYECHSGKRVMILEEHGVCGGAWTYVDVCGIAHADLGCHQIGGDQNMRKFLEEYVGCKLVALDNPRVAYGSNTRDDANGFYPSKGCWELIQNILRLIAATDIVLQLNTKVESAYIDVDRNIVEIKTKNGKYTTSKVVITQASSFRIENIAQAHLNNNGNKAKYYHLYLLVADPSPWCCTYRHGVVPGTSRMMNLTPFVGLDGTGMQLFVLQTYSEADYNKKNEYFEHLKKQNIIGKDAKLLCADSATYEQSYQYSSAIHQLPQNLKAYFEVLNTGHIQSIGTYAPKWKMVLKPYNQALAQN